MLRNLLPSMRKVSSYSMDQPPSIGLLPQKGHLLRICLYVASRPLTLAAAKYETRNTHYQRPAQNGTVTFRARRKYRRLGTISHECAQDIPELLEASFTFLPNNGQNPWISVDFKQSLSYEGSFLRRPALSVSAILPHDSEVFRLIEKGDLSGLIQSLSLRKAFLTDRDIDGRCLLHVSIGSLSTMETILKYLLTACYSCSTARCM